MKHLNKVLKVRKWLLDNDKTCFSENYYAENNQHSWGVEMTYDDFINLGKYLLGKKKKTVAKK